MRVQDVMSKEVVSVPPGTTIAAVRHDREGTMIRKVLLVCGIVSTVVLVLTDVARSLVLREVGLHLSRGERGGDRMAPRDTAIRRAA